MRHRKFFAFLFLLVTLTILMNPNNTCDKNQSTDLPTNATDVRVVKSSKEEWLEKQNNLRTHVRNTCSQNPSSKRNFSSPGAFQRFKNDLRFLIVDEKHKTLFCSISKVASTTWKTLFGIMNGQWKEEDHITSVRAHHLNLPTLASKKITVEEFQHYLNTYTKFMFVREPMERLVSAYKSKVEGTYIDPMKLTTRHEYLNMKGTSKSRVSFSQFLKYITDQKLRMKSPLNDHWESYQDLCFPCDIQYDFIGKYDTLHEDGEHILHFMNAYKEVNFPEKRRSKSKRSLAQYFDTISLGDMKNIMKIYENDYKMFDYIVPNEIYPSH